MSVYQDDTTLQRISNLLEGIQREAQGIKEELRKKRENSEMNQLMFCFGCYLVSLLSIFALFLKK